MSFCGDDERARRARRRSRRKASSSSTHCACVGKQTFTVNSQYLDEAQRQQHCDETRTSNARRAGAVAHSVRNMTSMSSCAPRRNKRSTQPNLCKTIRKFIRLNRTHNTHKHTQAHKHNHKRTRLVRALTRRLHQQRRSVRRSIPLAAAAARVGVTRSQSAHAHMQIID